MDDQPILTPTVGVFARRVNDEMVILDSTTEMYLELSPSAASMWEAAVDCVDRPSALERLARQWPDVDRERLERDFEQLIADVVARGLATAN